MDINFTAHVLLQDLSGFESKASRLKAQKPRQRSQDPSPSRSDQGPLGRGATGLSGGSSGPDLSMGRRQATFQDVALEEGQVKSFLTHGLFKISSGQAFLALQLHSLAIFGDLCCLTH